MKTLAIANQKGGVGKTTTALAIAHGAAARGKRVLLLDLDTQANASISVGAANTSPNIEDVFSGECNLLDAIRSAGSIHVVPASKQLARIKDEITLQAVKEQLESVCSFYDLCVIDTPPELGTLSLAALTAANGVLVPVQADLYSLDAAEQMSETIYAIQQSTNPNLSVIGLVFTFFNPRTILSREIKEQFDEVAKDMNTSVFKATIRRAQAAPDAATLQKPIREYAPRAAIAADYEALLDELKGRL